MKHKRYFLLIVLALLTVSTNINAQWESKTNGLPNDWQGVSAIAASDPDFIVIYIETRNPVNPSDYTFYYTSNGGNDWQKLPFPYEKRRPYIHSIDITPERVIRITADGELYTSSDVGQNWDVYDFSQRSEYLEYIKMFNEDNGVIIGSPYDSYKFWNAAFTDENTIYAAGWHNIHKSADGGITWDSTSIGNISDEIVTSYITDFYFLDSQNGFVLTSSPTAILKTNNGGISWKTHLIEGMSNTYGQIAAIDTNVYVVTGMEETYWTLNGGETWNKYDKEMRHLEVHNNKAITLTADSLFILGKNGEWVTKNIPSKDSYIRTKISTSENFIWLLTNIGELYKSSDEGSIWNMVRSLDDFHIQNFEFEDDLNGWLTTYEGEIYKTNDGGISWSRQYYRENQELVSIDFLDADRGIIGANFGQLLMTTNGGNTWQPVIDLGVEPLLIAFTEDGGETWTEKPWEQFNDVHMGCAGCNSHINFIDENIGYIKISGYYGNPLFKTIDGGTTWSKVTNAGSLSAISFYDKDIGYMNYAEYDYDLNTYRLVVRKTADGGKTWSLSTKTVLNGRGNVFQIAPWDHETIFIANDDTLAFSTNNGYIWNNYTLSTGISELPYLPQPNVEKPFHHLLLIDENNAWLAGGGGLLLHSNNPTEMITDLIEICNAIPSNYVLSQNYPNPFNPSTEIKYSIPEAGHVTLKVFNILGQEIATLVNTQQSAGTYQVTFDAKEYGTLASGVYMYQLTSGKFRETKKFILTK